MPLSSVTRLPAGLSLSPETGPLADMGIPWTFKYQTQLDDFFKFAAADWVVTGTGVPALVSPSNGGVLNIVNSAASGDETAAQFAGGNAAVRLNFLTAVASELFINARIALDNPSLASALFGLTGVATAPITTPPTNGIFFRRLFGANPWSCVIRNAGVETVVTSNAVPANNEFRELGFAYTPQNGKATFFDNGAAFPFTLPVPIPVVNMAVNQSVRNGSAAARTFSLDWYMVNDQR